MRAGWRTGWWVKGRGGRAGRDGSAQGSVGYKNANAVYTVASWERPLAGGRRRAAFRRVVLGAVGRRAAGCGLRAALCNVHYATTYVVLVWLPQQGHPGWPGGGTGGRGYGGGRSFALLAPAALLHVSPSEAEPLPQCAPPSAHQGATCPAHTHTLCWSAGVLVLLLRMMRLSIFAAYRARCRAHLPAAHAHAMPCHAHSRRRPSPASIRRRRRR